MEPQSQLSSPHEQISQSPRPTVLERHSVSSAGAPAPPLAAAIGSVVLCKAALAPAASLQLQLLRPSGASLSSNQRRAVNKGMGSSPDQELSQAPSGRTDTMQKPRSISSRPAADESMATNGERRNKGDAEPCKPHAIWGQYLMQHHAHKSGRSVMHSQPYTKQSSLNQVIWKAEWAFILL